jgi:hypothetical protein
MTKAILIAAALTLTVTAAMAAEVAVSANAIMPGCRAFVDRSSRDNLLKGFCVGAVSGVAYVSGQLRLFSPLTNDVRRTLCVNGPSAATNDQLVRVVIAYIEARPARIHETFQELALEALQAAWPCK